MPGCAARAAMPESDGDEREEREDQRLDAHTDPHRPFARRPVDLLQQARRDDERGPEQREQRDA